MEMILNKYPLPANAPKLMPFQDEPLNGDTFACEEFIRVRDKFHLIDAIETGTCFASTTLFLADNFRRVFTIENNVEYHSLAIDRTEKCYNKWDDENEINFFPGGSQYELGKMIALAKNPLIFLDAHWGQNCPLLLELSHIAKSGLKPVIIIHDFKVPGHPELGFDSYNGQDFEWEWIRPYIENIYGKEGFNHYYNSEATGANRGIIYITPKK